MTSAEVLREEVREQRRWNDTTLLALLRLVVASERRDCVEIEVIDPLVLSLLLESGTGKKQERDEKTVRHVRELFIAPRAGNGRAPKLVLVPVYWEKHWSLLAYATQFHHWYVCDSLNNYNEQRVMDILILLNQLKVVTRRDARIRFYDQLAQQESDYECGRYVVFYAFILLRNFTTPVSEEEFQARVEEELRVVTPQNRPSFETQLLQLLGEIK
jgi:hypothetical protein